MKTILILTSALLVAFNSTAIAVEIPKKPIDSPARSAFLKKAAARLISCKVGKSKADRAVCDKQWVKTVKP